MVGVRDPLDDADGGGSAIDNRCNADGEGDGGIRFGSMGVSGQDEYFVLIECQMLRTNYLAIVGRPR